MWPATPKAQRGYGKAWDEARKQALERDRYLCQCPECKATGRVRPATEVDHIKRKADAGTDDLSNLRSVNSECHKRITICQAGKTPRAGHIRRGWVAGVNIELTVVDGRGERVVLVDAEAIVSMQGRTRVSHFTTRLKRRSAERHDEHFTVVRLADGRTMNVAETTAEIQAQIDAAKC